jgi:integrase/recombinase XerD
MVFRSHAVAAIQRCRTQRRCQGLTEASHLDARSLNRFTSDLLTQGGRRGPLSRHTVDTYVRNVNLFLGWCRRQGEVGNVRAQAPKRPRRILDVLSREEIDRLEAAAAGERDKVVVRLLADSGIRASELLGLRSGDLLEQGRDCFLRILGAGGIHEHLTVSGLDQLIRGLAERAGFDKRVYPHLLRHSFAAEMLNRGMDAITLSRILGHSSLVMIQRTYANQTVGDLSAALLKALAEGRK